MSYFLYFFLLLFASCQILATEKQGYNENEIFNLAQANIEKHRKTEFILKFESNSKIDLMNIEIEAEQISHDFMFGCIIFDLVNHGRSPEDEELFKERFSQLFNFAVFPFYWAGYELIQGQTNEAKIREVAEWCIENGITTKGHPLAWTHTAGTPRWLEQYSDEESKKFLQQRIENIVSGFKDQIDIWDVLNEVIHTVNWDVAMQENRSGQDNRYAGRDFMSDEIEFIDSCFRWAHAANPDADLILNEFDIVYNENSRHRFYDLLKALQQKNSPVKGIGIQAHEPYKGRVYYSPQQIWETFETYSDFNLPLHITELIPVSNGDSIMGGYRTGIWTEQVQAEFAEMIFTLSFGHPLVHSVNWWGFSDRNIWQPNGGLVDENLNPKPVYETLDRLINQEWKTNKSGLKLNSKGEVTFRGFKGNYQIRIKQNGKLVKTVDVSYMEFTDVKKQLIINL